LAMGKNIKGVRNHVNKSGKCLVTGQRTHPATLELLEKLYGPKGPKPFPSPSPTRAAAPEIGSDQEALESLAAIAAAYGFSAPRESGVAVAEEDIPVSQVTISDCVSETETICYKDEHSV
jgi:hypothetical protein